MKTIIITGSTRGIGYALATGFLEQGHAVVISGRTQDSVIEAEESLSARFGGNLVQGLACDVRRPDQVQRLWDEAHARKGQIDIWVNNAGFAHSPEKFWQLDPALVTTVIETNLLGAMFGCQVATRGML